MPADPVDAAAHLGTLRRQHQPLALPLALRQQQHHRAVPAGRAGHGEGLLLPCERAGVGRLAATAGEEGAAVQDDPVRVAGYDLRLKARKVGIAVVKRLGHDPYLSSAGGLTWAILTR